MEEHVYVLMFVRVDLDIQDSIAGEEVSQIQNLAYKAGIKIEKLLLKLTCLVKL